MSGGNRLRSGYPYASLPKFVQKDFKIPIYVFRKLVKQMLFQLVLVKHMAKGMYLGTIYSQIHPVV